MNTPTVLQDFVLIRFQDCDPFQHLSNSKYIDYMVNAREDQLLAHYELDLYALAKEQGLGWVTSWNQIAYLRPAFPNEKVRVESQLLAYDAHSSQVEMRMLSADGRFCKSVLWSRFAFYDIRQQKAAQHTSDLLDLQERMRAPISEKSFEERVGFWRQYNRG